MNFKISRAWGIKIDREDLIKKYNIKEIENQQEWYIYEIFIRDLEQLIELEKDFGYIIIKNNNEIKIYDDYLE